jgi:ZIP family zinc transporter
VISSFADLNHVVQALLASVFAWAITATGASLVFAFREVNRRFLDAALGFAAGVMMAASLLVSACSSDRAVRRDGPH